MTTRSSKFALPLTAVFCLLGPFACSAGSTGEDVGVNDSEWVTQSTFDEMARIVKTIDYLPFRYKADGCYARALYMSMELAAEGYESNAVFAFAKPGYPLLVPPISWRYHVAPLLMVGPGEKKTIPMVVDPALVSHPITRSEWIERMGRNPEGTDAPNLLMVPGSRYAPSGAYAETEWANVDLPDFESLPKFKGRDIQDSCNVMHRYLAREPQGTAMVYGPLANLEPPTAEEPNGQTPNAEPPNASTPGETEETATDLPPPVDPPTEIIAEKQNKLVARTTYLFEALQRVGKVEDGATFSAERCRRGF